MSYQEHLETLYKRWKYLDLHDDLEEKELQETPFHPCQRGTLYHLCLNSIGRQLRKVNSDGNMTGLMPKDLAFDVSFLHDQADLWTSKKFQRTVFDLH